MTVRFKALLYRLSADHVLRLRSQASSSHDLSQLSVVDMTFIDRALAGPKSFDDQVIWTPFN
ncbi:MAG: hypothetical protein IPM25_11305 [Chloracidobacterium sp.]|nr:hypothetical protein [Chloracidobacterium sp.]